MGKQTTMYLITVYDTILVGKYASLRDFLYSKFEFKIKEGQFFIRPKNYENYVNKDFELFMSYSKEHFTDDEIISDFSRCYLANYAKRYEYKIYKIHYEI